MLLTIQPAGETLHLTIQPAGETLHLTIQPAGETLHLTIQPAGETLHLTIQPAEATVAGVTSHSQLVAMGSAKDNSIKQTVGDNSGKARRHDTQYNQ